MIHRVLTDFYVSLEIPDPSTFAALRPISPSPDKAVSWFSTVMRTVCTYTS